MKAYLRILLPCPTWYMPQEKAPKAARNMATALGPLLGIRRAYRTGAKPPGGGPSWRTGMSLTLAIPGFFLITASVIFSAKLWEFGGNVEERRGGGNVYERERERERERARLMCGVVLVWCCVYESETFTPIGRRQMVTLWITVNVVFSFLKAFKVNNKY
jgi:hypothetical protein